jgi:hypothetical protein
MMSLFNYNKRIGILNRVHSVLLDLGFRVRVKKSVVRIRGEVFAAAQWAGGILTHPNYGPVVTHTLPTIPVSFSGLNRVNCALC